jgi:predicted small integral membrane protein
MSPDVVVWAIFKAILVLGFALWTFVAALNNVTGFRGAAAAINGTMGMALLNDPPAIATPLARRAINSPRLAAASIVLILLLQIAAALLLGAGGALLFATGLGAAVPEWGVAAALAGFALLASLWFLMMIGGLWFGYWIRQEGLQLTHIGLLAVTIMAAAVTYS